MKATPEFKKTPKSKIIASLIRQGIGTKASNETSEQAPSNNGG